MRHIMDLEVGTTIQITKDLSYKEYVIRKGDIGIITYVASTGRYSVHIYGKENAYYYANRIYGNNGDFWISQEYVKRYEFKNGDRVRITSPKKSSYQGCFATVYTEFRARSASSKYQVVLFVDGTNYQYTPNTYKQRGLVLLSTSVELIDINNNESEETTMSLTGFKKVAVIKLGNMNYNYALYDDDIQVGDKVLVSGACNNIVEVSDIITKEEAKENFPNDIINITAEVKCKVDLSAYEQRLRNRKEATQLKKKMDEEIKKMDEINKYAMYAESNPELAKMLNQYKELVG